MITRISDAEGTAKKLLTFKWFSEAIPKFNQYPNPKGNLLQDPDVTFGHDAAGNNVLLSSPNGTSYTTTFDGDGHLVKKVHTFSGNTVFVKYSLRSSVLGGRIVTEVSGQGQKLSTYVFAGGQLLARQQGGAVAWEHHDPLSGSQVDSFADGAFSPINQLDPTGLDVGFQDPFTPCCDPPPPPSDSGTLLPMWGDGIPSGRCTLDGISIDCGWAFQMMNSGSAVQCPNNDCGPRVMNSFDRNGHFLGQVLSQAFQAFADGFSGFLPPGARYQGGGMWTIPGPRPSEKPSLKPTAPRPGAGAGNRNPDGGSGRDEGPGGDVSGSLGATPTFRFIGFPDPQNTYDPRVDFRDYAKELSQNNKITDCLKLALMIYKAGQAFGTDSHDGGRGIMRGLMAGLTDWTEVNLGGREGPSDRNYRVGVYRSDPHYAGGFGDSGFARHFQDDSNQVRHFVFYLGAGYGLPQAAARYGLHREEGTNNPQVADVGLGWVGIDLGNHFNGNYRQLAQDVWRRVCGQSSKLNLP